jgi:hypothetical protein
MQLHGVRALILGMTLLTSCTATDPHTTAKQQAQEYYGRSYESLSPEEKMHLEDHISRQSNEGWRTSAQVASGVGHLLQGAGLLVWGARR